MKLQLLETWRLDANETLQSALERADTPSLLRQTLQRTLSWQARCGTPVRRPLTSPRVAPRWVAALLVLGAKVVVEKATESSEMLLEEALQQKSPGEITGLIVPARGSSLHWGEEWVARTPADVPIVSAIALVELDGETVKEAQVALIGTWPEPVRRAEAAVQLAGGPLDPARIRQVAQAVEAEVAPKGDFRGSEAYRRAMAGVLTRRALEACLQ